MICNRFTIFIFIISGTCAFPKKICNELKKKCINILSRKNNSAFDIKFMFFLFVLTYVLSILVYFKIQNGFRVMRLRSKSIFILIIFF